MAPPLALALAAAGLAAVKGARVTEGSTEAYEAFRKEFGRAKLQGPDPVSYLDRLSLFEARRAKINALNVRPGATWVAGLNHLADYTEEERRMLLGYRRSMHSWAEPSAGSFLEVGPKQLLAASVDWRPKLHTSGAPRDQGGCGSCWAVAAVGAIETHSEIWTGKSHSLSFEQLVACVKNEQHCGGSGGCGGATHELAFDYVKENGLARAEDYQGGYMSAQGDTACHAKSWRNTGWIKGWEHVTPNKVHPLLEAVATQGPVVISVDASPWGEYRKGVFNDCGVNATVNHAVLLVGYGEDAGLNMPYWLIRNSWGQWGENGFIRLQRHGEKEHCGIDKDPQAGVGCDGGPKTVPVCGMCGGRQAQLRR